MEHNKFNDRFEQIESVVNQMAAQLAQQLHTMNVPRNSFPIGSQEYEKELSCLKR